jgi:hypothetical protein
MRPDLARVGRRLSAALVWTGVCLGLVAFACGCGVFSGNSARLQAAAREGDTAGVEALLAQGAATNVRDGQGLTPLHFAVQRADARMVGMLLAHGADVNAADAFRRTPLYLAAEPTGWAWRSDGVAVQDGALGAVEVCEALLKAGADPNVAGPAGVTPLHLAARAGAVQIVKQLLGAGADPARRDDSGRTPLHSAVGPRAEVVMTDPLRPSLHERQRLASGISGHWRAARTSRTAPGAAKGAANPSPPEDRLSRFEPLLRELKGEERQFAEYFVANGGHPAAALLLYETYGRDGADAVEFLAGHGVDVPYAAFVLQQMQRRHEREVVGLLLAIGAPVAAKDGRSGTPAQEAAEPDSVCVQPIATEWGGPGPQAARIFLSGELGRDRRAAAQFTTGEGTGASRAGAGGAANTAPGEKVY